MPHYTFALRDGSGAIEDRTGEDLPNPQSALEHAKTVARELMQGREIKTRTWRLDVYTDEGEPLFAVPFASIDQSLDHLVPEIRNMIVDFGERRRSLLEALHAARTTVLETRALVARSRGKPYLASVLGERTIRER